MRKIHRKGSVNISLIISAKNEASSLKEVIENAFPFVDEIIVAAGGSSDTTAEVAKNAGAIVSTDHLLGKGDAMRGGVTLTHGDIVVFIDADGSHDSLDIPKLVQPILEKKVKLVIASRALGGSDDSVGIIEGLIREVGNIFVSMVIRFRFRRVILDTQNGFRAMRKETFESLALEDNGTTIEQEMLIKAIRKGYSILEIASHESARRFGKSRINVYRDGWKYVISLIKLCV